MKNYPLNQIITSMKYYYCNQIITYAKTVITEMNVKSILAKVTIELNLHVILIRHTSK